MTSPPEKEPKPPEEGGNIADELAYRLQQQAITAEFGLFALRTHDMPALLHEGSRLSALGLQTEFGKVMEYLPDDREFIVRAGVGWKPGVVGHARGGADLESPAGYAFQTGSPVISNHLQSETRFRTPAILLEHGVKRAINVLIRGDGDRYGVLEVDSGDAGRFTEADLAFLQGFANLIGVAIERQLVEEALVKNERRLQNAMARQDMLTKEMSHRVKNSLMMVTGLLDMQARGSTDLELHRALGEARARVHAIAQVHDWLWRSDDVTSVDVADFLGELCKQLQRTGGDTHTLCFKVTSIVIPADLAIPLGLLVNELVTNAFKYAYPESSGEVQVSLTAPSAGWLRLEVSDNGVGLSDVARANERASLGMRLIATLSSQLGGEAFWPADQIGTHFVLQFPC